MGLEVGFDAVVASLVDAFSGLGAAGAAGAGAAGAADAAGLGLGAGFASDAAIAGGAGLGGLGAGLGAGAGLATDLGLGAGFASDAAIAGGAGGGIGAGALDAAGIGAGSAFGGIASDAAGGATLAEGIPLASTYGPVAAFSTDLAGTAGGGLSAADLASSAGGGLSSTATPAADVGTTALSSTPTVAPGVETTAPLSANAQALGAGTAPAATTAPGPGALASAPPISVNPASLDPTSALAQSQGGNLFSGAVDTSAVSPADAVTAEGEAGTLPGQTATAGATQSAADAAGGLPVPPQAPGLLSQGWDAISGGINDVGTALNSPAGKVLSTGVAGLGLVNSLASAQKPNPIPGMAQLQAIADSLGASGKSLNQTGQNIAGLGTGLIAPNTAASTGVAEHATSQASTLENYLNTGSLPPAVQASLDQATQSAITGIKAQFAARGMPPGSSAEQQEIAAVRQNAVIQGGTLAAQLYSQGVGLDQLAASIYQNLTGTGAGLVGTGVSAQGAGTSAQAAAAGATESLVGTNTALNTGVNNAIANLASALGGGNRAIVNGNTVTLPNAA